VQVVGQGRRIKKGRGEGGERKRSVGVWKRTGKGTPCGQKRRNCPGGEGLLATTSLDWFVNARQKKTPKTWGKKRIAEKMI